MEMLSDLLFRISSVYPRFSKYTFTYNQKIKKFILRPLHLLFCALCVFASQKNTVRLKSVFIVSGKTTKFGILVSFFPKNDK